MCERPVDTLDEMRAERDVLEKEICSIKNAIEAYRLRPRSMPTDDDWFRRASAALRIKGQRFNQINRDLGRAEKSYRRGRNDSRERAFIAAAKRRLAPDVYQAIWDEVEGSDV